MANLERIYTIPLGSIYAAARQKRGKRAVAFVKRFALRHMKAEKAKISEGINSAILRDGIQKPPRRIKVRIVKDEKGVAKVWLIGEEEKLKELAEREKKAEEAAKKEQEKQGEAKKGGEANKEAQKAAAPKPAEPAPAAKQAATSPPNAQKK